MKKIFKITAIYPRKILLFASLFFFVNCSFLIGNCFSQPSITWQRAYDGPDRWDDILYSVCNADNGSFYAVGSSAVVATNRNAIFVVKLNAYGDTIWTRIIGGYGLSQYALASVSLSDGSLVLTGGNDTAFALKLDLNGNLIWHKRYPVNLQFQYADLYDIICTSDNGFLLCGKFGYSQACFYKIDGFGNLQWYRIDSGPFRKVYRKMLEVTDGFIIAGQVYNSVSDPSAMLMKLNYAGGTLWEKEYKVNNYGMQPGAIISNSVGVLFFGTAYYTQQDREINCILKIDNSGAAYDTIFVISTSHPLNWNDVIQNVVKVNPNKFLLTSLRPGRNALDTPFAEAKLIDSTGNILTMKTFKILAQSELFHGVIAQSGGFIFSGFVYETENSYSDGLLVKTDSLINSPPIGIEKMGNEVPHDFVLSQNYPNPFNPTTEIKFGIPKSEIVTLKVFDLLGREVWSYKDFKTAGSYNVTFDGSNLASGIYFYQLEAGEFVESKKMVLIK